MNAPSIWNGGPSALARIQKTPKRLVPHGDQARADGEDVLRGQRHADDLEAHAAAVHDGRHEVARSDLVGLREGLVDEHLAGAAGLGQPTLAKVQVVQQGAAAIRDRHEPPQRGLGEARDVEHHVLDDARIDRADAGESARDAATDKGARSHRANTSPSRERS